MAIFFEDKDRRVLPNFRSLKKTIELGELDSISISSKKYVADDLESYILDFKKDNSIGNAGELISAAIVNNDTQNAIVKSAAHFVLDNGKNASRTLEKFAKKILGLSVEEATITIDGINDFLEENSLPLIYKRISEFKHKIEFSPKDPFLYCELARMYSIIAQKDKSLFNIHVAYNLSPHNRYVLRSFVRTLAHFKETEMAHYYLKKNSLTKVDPWILASEIAISTLRGKRSNFLKKGIDLLASKKFNSFSTSELASSIGTVEMIYGTRKKSKDFFATALNNPNDNSLAQVEWANNKENYFVLNMNQFHVKNNYEASAYANYNSRDWTKAVECAERWFIDMPFTKRPIMLAHNVASYFLEDHDAAIKFCKAGLVANPKDEMLINNLAYSYAVNNDTKTSFEWLRKININSIKDVDAKICLLATTGLAYYRDGKPEEGRSFYMSAMEEAKENGLKNYFNLAMVHFMLEEIINDPNSTFAANLKEQLEKIPSDDINHPEFKVMKDKVLKLIEKGKK